MVKRPLTRIVYPRPWASASPRLTAIEPNPFRPLATTARLGHSGATPTTVLLSAEETKAWLHEIIEGFFFHWRNGWSSTLLADGSAAGWASLGRGRLVETTPSAYVAHREPSHGSGGDGASAAPRTHPSMPSIPNTATEVG